jgi:hypothetical protein
MSAMSEEVQPAPRARDRAVKGVMPKSATSVDQGIGVQFLAPEAVIISSTSEWELRLSGIWIRDVSDQVREFQRNIRSVVTHWTAPPLSPAEVVTEVLWEWELTSGVGLPAATRGQGYLTTWEDGRELTWHVLDDRGISYSVYEGAAHEVHCEVNARIVGQNVATRSGFPDETGWLDFDFQFLGDPDDVLKVSLPKFSASFRFDTRSGIVEERGAD